MHKHYPLAEMPKGLPIVPLECKARDKSGAVLELDIVGIVDIKVEKVKRGAVTGLCYPEVFDD